MEYLSTFTTNLSQIQCTYSIHGAYEIFVCIVYIMFVFVFRKFFCFKETVKQTCGAAEISLMDVERAKEGCFRGGSTGARSNTWMSRDGS